ncbi:MAG: SHOCT domain-containing protein [Nitrospirota bacterium]|nr:SHOCT domain-containing protein [Nitrospirota bacterium]
MRTLESIALIVVLLMVGCATASPVQMADKSASDFEGAVYGGEVHFVSEDMPGSVKYRIFHQGALLFTSVQSVRGSATQRTEAFCARNGKVPQVITEQTSTPPHILGNFPRIELVFVCVNDPKTAPASVSKDVMYERLKTLKSLLDSGTITQQEFDVEKKTILSQ